MIPFEDKLMSITHSSLGERKGCGLHVYIKMGPELDFNHIMIVIDSMLNN